MISTMNNKMRRDADADDENQKLIADYRQIEEPLIPRGGGTVAI